MRLFNQIERHILRNFIYLYALEHGLNIPIGTQDAELLDTRNSDEDADSVVATLFDPETEDTTDATIEISTTSFDKGELRENAEVVGTDEAFFEDDDTRVILDLYNEKSGILDGEEDTEVDLTSEAFQIWKKATDDNPALQKTIEELPNSVYSTRAHIPTPLQPEGVLVYMKTAEGNDSLVWVDRYGESVTQSQLAILRTAAFDQSIKAISKDEQHHKLVKQGAQIIAEEEKSAGGQLGRPSDARFRTYERLKHYSQQMQATLFVTEELLKAVDDIYRYPLRQSAVDTLNRQLRSGISDRSLAELVVALRQERRLCIVSEEVEKREPQIICSLGLFPV